ncbi:MAG: restriction endonuclease subunit S [Sulfuricurvum sp.]
MSIVSYEKNLIVSLGFTAKENTNGLLHKKYADNYAIEVDFINEKINYGDLIRCDSKTTQNFSQQENWVVLECVDRLLEKGYKPNHITLEKVFPSGHGTSGRLDILVYRDDGTAYMMIECKTWGSEFDKELKNLNKDGGQLFTYFQQDNNTDILVLYASRFDEDDKCVEYTNQIVKVEEEYRTAGNVKDFYDRWNKLPKNNGIFESFAEPYGFISKALTRKDLKALKSEDSSFIFNRFLEILRHNVVSDKPNAFNKIFTLFLCKIVDENRQEDEELHFQWLEGKDTAISFQKRLSDLYTKGMKELLEKEVTDVSDSQFDKEFQQVDDLYRDKFKDILTEIRLKKNNEFAIKEVYDDDSFNENAIVVKEIVELLQTYQIRYNYRQQFLSDFFELLLTTGLKQESGQFFTPVPVARFIIRSIPFIDIAKKKIEKADTTDLLPLTIDYSAGSGHFITESMEELQNYIDTIDTSKLNPTTAKTIKKWQVDQFDWAEDYVYAIEKDYGLVKTAKVSCYLHGDGLAKVIHGDGLADFATAKEYKDRLKKVDKTYPQDNKEFDIIVSNPPYSVSAFKGMMNSEKSANNFELYGRLTDQSSEIEALFIERTKQLLKDGGVAGVILPSSILSNGGIYADAREIILKYFDIIAITELGSNTFMATGTNTVVLFLRRRNNADHRNIKESIAKLFENKNDITINGVETPLSKYLAHAYDGMAKDDYFASIKNSTEEQEKLLYFIIAYPQKVVIVKTGSKNDEKKFLGYEFSTRRGSEGIHPIQRDKTIDECTMLYDPNSYENEKRASSYIYSAYKGEFKAIDEALKENVSYTRLVDMLDFERVDFKNTITLNNKKKVVIESKWDLVRLGDFVSSIESGNRPKGGVGNITSGAWSLGGEHIHASNGMVDLSSPKYVPLDFYNKSTKGILQENDILLCKDGALTGKVAILKQELINQRAMVNEHIFILRCNTLIKQKYLFNLLYSNIGQLLLKINITGAAQGGLNSTNLKNIKIPIPPIGIQEQIVKECEEVDSKVHQANETIVKSKENIISTMLAYQGNISKQLGEICDMKAGKFVSASDISDIQTDGMYPCYGGNGLRGYTKTFTHDGIYPLIGRQGALCGNVFLAKGQFHATEHAVAVTPLVEMDITWLYHQLVMMNLNQYAKGTAQPGLSVQNLKTVSLFLPPVDVQKQIVSDIETLEAKITEAKSVIENAQAKKEAILKKYL